MDKRNPKVYDNLLPTKEISEDKKALLFGGLILIGFLSAIMLIAGLTG